MSATADEILNSLLNKGADVNRYNGDGEAPLHVATAHKKVSLVRLLVEHEATMIDLLSTDGDTALHIAVRERHPDIVATLAPRDGNINDIGKRLGKTPLCYAVNDYFKTFALWQSKSTTGASKKRYAQQTKTMKAVIDHLLKCGAMVWVASPTSYPSSEQESIDALAIARRYEGQLALSERGAVSEANTLIRRLEEQYTEEKTQGPILFFQQHLRRHYQRTARYLPLLRHEKSTQAIQWPIVKTYRQLMIVEEQASQWHLYGIDALNRTALPDISGLPSHCVVITHATSEPSSDEKSANSRTSGAAHFILGGAWVRMKGQETLLSLPIVLPRGYCLPPCLTHFLLKSADEAALLEDARKAYGQYLHRSEQLHNYEQCYEDAVRYRVSIEQLFTSQTSSTSPASPQKKPIKHVLITGRAGIGKSTLLQYLAYRWSLATIEAEVAPLWQPDTADGYSLVFWLPLKRLHGYRASGEALTEDRCQRLAGFIMDVCGIDSQDSHIGTPSFSLSILADLLRTRPQRILLLVDSFDEVAHWLKKPDDFIQSPWTQSPVPSQASSLQKEVLDALFHWEGPMIVTTRPYFKSLLPEYWPIDRLVQNEGFLDKDIRAYVKHYFATITGGTQEERAALLSGELLHVLKHNPNLWGLAHVPLMTRLLCTRWSTATTEQRAMAQKEGPHLTLTTLMTTFVGGLSQTRHQADDTTIANRTYQERAMKRQKPLLDALGELAFEGLLAGYSQLLPQDLQRAVFKKHYAQLPKDSPYRQKTDDPSIHVQDFFAEALTLGLLKAEGPSTTQPLDSTYSFIHLLFQEYLAGRHVAHHVSPPETYGNQKHGYSAADALAPFSQAIDEGVKTSGRIADFIRHYRYSPRYQYVFTFAAGLVNSDKQAYFWDTLRQSPLTVDRIADTSLGLMCLNETLEPHTLKIDRNKLCDSILYQEVMLAVKTWLDKRLKQRPEDFIKNRYIDEQWQSLWQGLTPSLMEMLLKPWHNAMEETLKAEGTGRVAGGTFRLWHWLNAIGPAALPGLPPGFTKLCLETIQSTESHKRQQGFDVIQALSRVLVSDRSFILALLKSATQREDPDRQRVALGALHNLDTTALAHNDAFVDELEGCLLSTSAGRADSALRVLLLLGKNIFDTPLQGYLLHAWWSWNREIHTYAQQIMAQGGYTLGLDARILYGLVSAELNEKESVFKPDRNATWWQSSVKVWMPIVWSSYVPWRHSVYCALQSEKVPIRQMALMALSGLGATVVPQDESLRAGLVSGLESPDHKVRSAALEALGRLGKSVLGDEKLKEALLEGLESSDCEVRSAALEALGELGALVLGDEILKSALLAGLKNQEPWVRSAALGALGELGALALGDEILKSALLEGLESSDCEVRSAALEALGRLGKSVLGDEKLKAKLVSALESGVEGVHSAALEALGRLGKSVLGDANLKAKLVSALKEKNNELRSAALRALGGLGKSVLDDEALKTELLKGLESGDRRVRSAAWRVLGGLGASVLGNATLKAKLVSGLESSDCEVHSAALEALGGLGASVLDNEIFKEALLKGLEIFDPEVCLAAWRAFGRLGASVLDDETLKEAFLKGLEIQKLAVRQASGGLDVPTLDDETLKGALLKSLESGDKRVRSAAWRAFVRLSASVLLVDATLKAKLVSGLDSGDFGVCSAAWEALGGLGASVLSDETLKAKLVSGLDSGDFGVRSAAWRAFVRLSASVLLVDATLKAKLVSGLDSGDFGVCSAAWEALGGLGASVLSDETLKEALLKSLESGDERVHSAAWSVLSGLGASVLKDETLKEAFLKGLNNSDPKVRSEALKALDRLGGASVLDDEPLKEAFLKGLNNFDPKVRSEARSVGRLGVSVLDEKNAPLEAALESPDCEVRSAAWKALEHLGKRVLEEEEFKVALLNGLTAESTVMAALDALAALGVKVQTSSDSTRLI